MVRINFWTRLAIVVLFHVLIVFGAAAQTYEPINGNSKGFDVESGTKVAGSTITVDGHTFDVYTTKSGSKYIKSNNGSKFYPVWIGEPHVGTYDGRNVRKSKKGTPFVLYCTDGKQVTVKYLKVKAGS